MNKLIPFWEFFTDPVLQASTISSMLMCLASSIMAVIVFIKRRSLIGEALSHATYPGIALSVLMCAGLFTKAPGVFPFVLLIGALISSLLGMRLITFMEEKLSVKSDSALCFVLSTFLGFGVFFASRLQFSHPIWFQKIQMFLYGQAATMLSIHVILYAILTLIIALFVVFLFYQIQAIGFDKMYTKVLGLRVNLIESLTLILIVIAVVIGIRSVGVVLMSGMLIAPAAAARQLTNNLSKMFLFSGFFGVISGFLGNYFSVNLSIYLMQVRPLWRVSLPTGPMILIVAACITFLCLILAPNRGLVTRLYRRQKFQLKVLRENILKEMYKTGSGQSFIQLGRRHRIFAPILLIVVCLMRLQGWISKENKLYILSDKGTKKACRIIRLHRLWEVYLYTHLGYLAENVHKSAEEMEHIITPNLEKKLSQLLKDPKLDPHDQIIPAGDG